MSHDLLVYLAERYAFDATPAFADLGVYHVPFDSMTGGDSVEARLRASTARGERIALIAKSGDGKSGAMSHVLGPTAPGVAPILVPVRPLDEGAATPARVADEILHLIRRYARHASVESVTGTARRISERHRRSSGLVLAGPWLKGELAKQIQRQTEIEVPIPLREKTELIDQILRMIHRDDLQPVVVFDDTDRWLFATDAGTIHRFFHEVVRWLTELPVSVVVATHDQYLTGDARRVGPNAADLLEFLDTRIDIPRVPSVSAFALVLAQRITCNTQESGYADAALDAVIEELAVEVLFESYAQGASLRRTLQTAHIALSEAVGAGADTIGADHVIAAQRA